MSNFPQTRAILAQIRTNDAAGAQTLADAYKELDAFEEAAAAEAE